MAEKRIVYMAKDGSEFGSEIEANAHDLLQSRGAEIDRFLSAIGIKELGSNNRINPHRVAARNLIAKWLSYVPA